MTSEKLVLANAFALSMLPPVKEATVHIRRLTIEEAREIVHSAKEIVSAIGHAGTAAILKELLGVEVPVNRIMVTLEKGTPLLVFTLLIRLEEGKVLTKEEVEALFREGKAAFFLVTLL